MSTKYASTMDKPVSTWIVKRVKRAMLALLFDRELVSEMADAIDEERDRRSRPKPEEPNRYRTSSQTRIV